MPPRRLYALLIEADPGSSLGGSCVRDLFNMANHLKRTAPPDVEIAKIFVLTNKFLGEKNIAKFPRECIFEVIYDVRKQVAVYLSGLSYRATDRTSDRTSGGDDYVISFVMISGHGYQRRDGNGDEVDGCDEYIQVNGATLVDDELHQLFVSSMKKGKFVGIADTCHSGTMFDLNYTLGDDGVQHVATKTPKALCCAVSIGACTDQQLESCDVGETTGFGGALSIHLMENNLVWPLILGDKEELLRVKHTLRPIFAKLGQTVSLQTS